MNDLSRTRKPLLLAGTAVVALLVLAWFTLMHKSSDAAKGRAPQAIVVDTATVAQTDVPIYLEGLGAVQALYTVTVTARVDGELQNVAFTEGQNVRKGDLLAQIDPRPNKAALDQALATKAKDEAQLVNAKLDLERYVVLQPQDLSSKQTVDTQRSVVDQLTAQLRLDQAVVNNAQTQLEYTRITSPINGRTGIRMIDPGNIVRAATAAGIVVVTQVQPISVVFTLPGEELDAVRAAKAAGPVEVTTLSRDGTTELERGTLTLIDNQIDPGTGTVKLKATYANANDKLWPGQYVNARVLVRTDRNVLVVPTTSIQIGPSGPFTYVVRADSSVESRPLTISEESGGMTVVKAGLSLNERVVTSNQYRLQPGDHIRTEAAQPSPAGNKSGPKSP